MTVAMAPRALRRGRTRMIHRTLAWGLAVPALVAVLGAAARAGAQGPPLPTPLDMCASGSPATRCLVASAGSVTIVNNLPASSICPNGNTVSVFTTTQQPPVQPGGHSITVSGDFSTAPGIGIQVNNWYWTSDALPVQTGPPQNPDNSGAQVTISDQCVLSSSPAWYGKGIPTNLIAEVAARKSSGGCTITIALNAYTNAVTPGCCSPPGIGSDTCTGPWGVTNNGQPWPPR